MVRIGGSMTFSWALRVVAVRFHHVFVPPGRIAERLVAVVPALVGLFASAVCRQRVK